MSRKYYFPSLAGFPTSSGAARIGRDRVYENDGWWDYGLGRRWGEPVAGQGSPGRPSGTLRGLMLRLGFVFS